MASRIVKKGGQVRVHLSSSSHAKWDRDEHPKYFKTGHESLSVYFNGAEDSPMRKVSI
jgi:hypothetical protein